MTKKRILFFIVGCILSVMAGCSPLASLPTATVTPEPTATTRPILSINLQVTPSPIPQTCTVTTGVPDGYLNLRVAPGTNRAVIRVLAEGETLQVIASGAWLEVINRDGKRGYVNSKYCKVEP